MNSALKQIFQRQQKSPSVSVPFAASGVSGKFHRSLSFVAVASPSVSAMSSFSTGKFNVTDASIEINERLLQRIDAISNLGSYYETDEVPPDGLTRTDAKQIVSQIFPSNLLEGADVYGYYGEVNIVWERNGRKIKLIVPPHSENRSPSIYHGMMGNGRASESALEADASVDTLQSWLERLRG